MKILTLIFMFCLAVSLTACGSAKSQKPAADTAKNPEPNSPNTSTGVTGIPACDDYLADVEKILANPNIPQVTRDTYRHTLEQNRIAWRQASHTLQSKIRLEKSCKAASDSLKPILEQ